MWLMEKSIEFPRTKFASCANAYWKILMLETINVQDV